MTVAADGAAAFSRVVAALDTTCRDAETLAAAVDVAARFDVEVSGLFIEDANLFRLAALPMARHVAMGSMAARPLDAAEMENEMRARAARAAAALAASATQQGVKWSFRVVRGLPAAELASATAAEDLLVVAPPSVLTGMPVRLTSPLQAAVRKAQRSSLHLPQRSSLSRPLVVVRAGSTLAARTLTAGMRVARAHTRDITLLLERALNGTDSAARPIAASLSAAGYRSRVHEVDSLTIDQIFQAARSGGHDVLVLPADLPSIADDEAFQDLLINAGCDVLVIQ